MPRTREPHQPSRSDAERGVAAERDFQDWLDRSGVAHLYIEQSPFTVPEPLRGRIKRPDYLVAIPHVGLVAFDVKSKSVYGERFLFDMTEVRKLRVFSRLFRLSVFFACLDTEGSAQAWWVRLDELDDAPVIEGRHGTVLSLPLERAQPVSLKSPFLRAFHKALLRT